MIPALHTPADVATALGCSEWWVREQARQRRFPHIRAAGGAIRFTDAHVGVILSGLERPAIDAVPDTTAGRQPKAERSVALLQPRTPRRARRRSA